MKLTKMNLIITTVIMCSFLTDTHVSAKELPNVNVETATSHRKELVGAKRSPQSTVDSKVASQITTKLVFKLVSDGLPKKYKKDARRLTQAIVQEANKYGMDPLFLVSVISHESSFRPDAIGGVGEIGLMQIRPTTAEWLNQKHKIVKKVNLKDPVNNVKIGAFYFSTLRDSFEQNSRWYISAYNMGSANVRKNLAKNVNPKEYVQNVMKYYVKYVDMLQTEFKQTEAATALTVASLQ